MSVYLRNLAVGSKFTLCRTGERYEFLGFKRETPGGTKYVVRRFGFAKPTTLHPSCLVKPLEGSHDKR